MIQIHSVPNTMKTYWNISIAKDFKLVQWISNCKRLKFLLISSDVLIYTVQQSGSVSLHYAMLAMSCICPDGLVSTTTPRFNGLLTYHVYLNLVHVIFLYTLSRKSLYEHRDQRQCQGHCNWDDHRIISVTGHQFSKGCNCSWRQCHRQALIPSHIGQQQQR